MSDSVYCGQCGHANSANNKFCSECGTSLRGTITETVQSVEYEYFDFGWRAERGKDFGRILAKKGFNQELGEALTEPYARLHFWQISQDQILGQLQSFFDKGWQPVTEVGPGCIEIVPSYEWDQELNLRSLFRTLSPQWCFIGVHVKLQRPKS